jgi:hypothetical protein
MCNFLSAIVLRNGDVRTHDASDSHSELIDRYGLPEDTDLQHYAKVEFTPYRHGAHSYRLDYADVDRYTLAVDEPTEPKWWPEVRDRVEATLRAHVRRMVVSDRRRRLLGGRWILVDGARVEECRDAEVLGMEGDACIGILDPRSHVRQMAGTSRIQDAFGQVDVMYDEACVANLLARGTVDIMWDRAKIGHAYDESCVGAAHDQSEIELVAQVARVGYLRNRARIGWMTCDAHLGAAWEESRIEGMSDRAAVVELRPRARIGLLRDHARVHRAGGQVGELLDHARIEIDEREPAPAAA